VAPPRKHETDAILDAARAVVLREGPRAAGVAAIAKESGAPVGTLYHRFGNRDAILAAAWLRALERFQQRCLSAAGRAAEGGDAIDVGAALAVSSVAFARELPEDSQLLLSVRRDDLLDASPGVEFRARLDQINSPLEAELREVARGLHGRADARSVDAVMRAVVDLPYAAIRRHAQSDPMPSWLENDVEDSARALLARI
jgi:AcrR family transcriptional regulator